MSRPRPLPEYFDERLHPRAEHSGVSEPAPVFAGDRFSLIRRGREDPAPGRYPDIYWIPFPFEHYGVPPMSWCTAHS